MKKIIILLVVLCCSVHLNAQEKELSPILFIYDASGSMWGKLQNKTKKEIAADVLTETVNNLPNNQNVGLLVYGHTKKGDCNDIEYLVDLSNNSKEKVTKAVKSINSLGKTPLARSTTMAINSLKKTKTKATIILITDGIESCDGDICDVVSKAKLEGIDFKMHVVGFGLKKGEKEQLKCAAGAGNGNYYDANNANGLGEVLTVATSETVDDPKGDFSVYATKNGKPVDAWVKAINKETNKEIDFARTYRDTSYLYLPAGKYTLQVRPLENSKIKGTTVDVESIDGIKGHQTVSFDGGKINIITTNNKEGWDSSCKVKTQEGKVVVGTRTYGKPRVIEINAGVYDITVQGLKMKGLETVYTIEDVKVESGKTVEAVHNFDSGIAMIGAKNGNTLVDALVKISDKATKKNVAGSRTYTSSNSNPRTFVLNPGVYEVSVRGLKKEYAGKIETFTIEVKVGETVTKTINF
ncbi:VWA domain-containing protein [Algibacter sp. 2305UL17-15]|uniref:vWA domain-containing protein n=1 Tax=Algibacter sp. 2305UL17-15 TaxID=3231268 RepID=UPI003459EB19